MKTVIGITEFEPGIYRHYKGGLYRAIALVAHHETREPWVLYVSLKQGSLNIRPLEGLDGWNTPAPMADRQTQAPRFELVNDSLDGLEGE